MGPIHRRLIGTWKSDKRRTLQVFKAYGSLPLARKRRLGSIFGKVELRYTPRFAYVTLDGQTTRDRYEVVGEDAHSIVLRIWKDEFKKRIDPILVAACEDFFEPTLEHLNLETIRGKDYYWIGLRVLVEWFRKLPPIK